MTVIGLTGGIGSGKSTVSRLFEAMGIPVYIADTESKRLTESSPVIKEKLTERFGMDLYAAGKLNKTLLSSLIFENENNRNFVNSVIHPEVWIDFERWKAQHTNSPVLIIETALLFETGYSETVDIAVTVAAPEELRISRLICREGWSRQEILSRIRSQFPEEEKILRSNYVIYNDDRQAVIPQVEKILKEIIVN